MSRISGFGRLVRSLRSTVLSTAMIALVAPVTHAGSDPCAAGSGPVFAVTNLGAGDYVIDMANDPALTVVRGCTYTFNLNNAGHPFLIKTVQGSGAGNTYNTGVTGNGTQVGTLTWTVALDAPASLFYNCQFHSPMTGTITVIDAPVETPMFVDGFE